MKLVEYHWDHPALAKYRRDIPAGQYLFKKGARGTTMFIIVKGLVQLVSHRDGADFPLHTLGAGQFLGEKAVMSDAPHERFFSAVARTEVTVLELGLDAIARIREAHPALMTELLSHMFRIAAERLEHANRLTTCLYPSDPRERLIRALLLFAARTAATTPEGTQIVTTVPELCYYIEMSEPDVKACLGALESMGILFKESENSFLVRNPSALAKAASLLPLPSRKRKAA